MRRRAALAGTFAAGFTAGFAFAVIGYSAELYARHLAALQAEDRRRAQRRARP